MKKFFVFLTRALLVLTFISFNSNIANGEETELILQQLGVLQKDIKTLEKQFIVKIITQPVKKNYQVAVVMS